MLPDRDQPFAQRRMHHVGRVVGEAAQIAGGDLVVRAEIFVVQPLSLVPGMQQPPGVLRIVGLVEDDLPWESEVSNAYQEGEDRESRCQQPTGQSILELAVLKRLDSPHHADSLGEGSDTEFRPLVLLPAPA